MLRKFIESDPNLYKKVSKVYYNMKSRSGKKYSDKEYIAMQYEKELGKPLDVENPKTFNEKIQWMKLNYRNPNLSTYVDKYEVREYVAKKIGGHVLNEVYGLYERVEDIDLEKLPDSFVLKGTHDSGSTVICKDKSQLDWKKAQITLFHSLARDHYHYAREWAYKHVEPRIICEEILLENNESPKDYKFFCFNGVPKFIQVDTDRHSSHKKNIYDTDWNLLDVEFHHVPKDENGNEKPAKLEEMLKYAEILSEDLPFVRLDFYEVNKKVMFGEMTFYPEGGHIRFTPEEYDTILGEMLELPEPINSER